MYVVLVRDLFFDNDDNLQEPAVDIFFKEPSIQKIREIVAVFCEQKIVKLGHLEAAESVMYEFSPPFFSKNTAYKHLTSYLYSLI